MFLTLSFILDCGGKLYQCFRETGRLLFQNMFTVARERVFYYMPFFLLIYTCPRVQFSRRKNFPSHAVQFYDCVVLDWLLVSSS